MIQQRREDSDQVVPADHCYMTNTIYRRLAVRVARSEPLNGTSPRIHKVEKLTFS